MLGREEIRKNIASMGARADYGSPSNSRISCRPRPPSLPPSSTRKGCRWR
jgi:hypothetical protein